MVRKSSILVLAHRTALSAGLEAALRSRAATGPASFTLVVPIGRGTKAREQAKEIGAQLAQSGLEIRAISGATDPLTAVCEAWNPAEYDEIIVSTLPAWNSRWMKTGLPQRIERQTGALVRHFETRESPPATTERPGATESSSEAGRPVAKAQA